MSDSKKKPFSPTDNYVEVHNALFMLYTRLPDFKPDHALAYVILMSYYNVELGYAFPTKAELALRLNCGINKPGKIVKVLEKYGLVKCEERDRAKIGSNDIYYVYAPITDEEEFNRSFSAHITGYQTKEESYHARNDAPITEYTREETDVISWL